MAGWKHVWITGASSGIGAKLAVSLANAGSIVSISARSTEKLEALRQQHEGLHPVPLDVTDQDAVSVAVQLMEQTHGPIDLAILNAGIWVPSDPGTFDHEVAARSIKVNYLGVTNALSALLPKMKQREGGQISIVASVAGYRGLPKGAYYAPTKAALISLAESLQPELSKEGIKIQLINPGFVDTPMTRRNTFPMPFLMNVEDAVGRIVNGLHSNKFEVAFPWQLVAILKICRILPNRLYLWLMRHVVARN